MVEGKTLKKGLVDESIEIAKDKEFTESYKKAKNQVKKRDFAKWHEL